MQSIDFNFAEKQLHSLITQVSDEHEPLCISSPDKENAVLLSETDYRGLMETLYLLSNPVNAEKLMAAAQRPASEAIDLEKAKIDLGL